MSEMDHSLPSHSAPRPTFVRFGPKATFPGMGPNGREVPITAIAHPSAHIGNRLALLGELTTGIVEVLPLTVGDHDETSLPTVFKSGIGRGRAASRVALRLGTDLPPSRPVRIVVGFAPGGVGDITTRLIGQWLSERLGQQFVIG